MDWTLFGNVTNTLAALVTIGAPIFSFVRAVLHSKQGHFVVSQSPVSAQTGSQSKEQHIPWYIWMKVIGYTLAHILASSSSVIIIYPLLGMVCMGGLFVFCFLVGIPTEWLHDQNTSTRVVILCSLLLFSLHYSIEFAEHSDEWVHEEIQAYNERLQRIQKQGEVS